jgi:predicted RNA-binding Zn ribbon-like protein
MDQLAAPQDLSAEQIVLAFANSQGSGHHADRFADGPGLEDWLHEVGWFGASHAEFQITDADAAEARELRDALVVILLAHARDARTETAQVEAAEALLRRAGGRYQLTARIDAEGADLSPAQTGIAGVFGQVLGSVTSLALADRWSRVKACRHEPCHRAFLDTTRNRSAVYCRSKCSSRASMRAYRARRRAGHTGETEA